MPVYMKAERVPSPVYDRKQEVCRDHSPLCSPLSTLLPTAGLALPKGLKNHNQSAFQHRGSCSVPQILLHYCHFTPGLSSST